MTDSVAVASAPRKPTLTELFLAFASVSIVAFGGALPWARRMIIERRHWMTSDEFNEAFSLAQFLPGPNVINFSVVFGSRMGGAAGAAIALIGLLGPPVLIVLVLALLYAIYGDLPALSRILTGVAAAAAGLMAATVLKMLIPIFRGGWVLAPPIALAGFLAIGILHWSLPLVLIVLIPVSIALAWMRR